MDDECGQTLVEFLLLLPLLIAAILGTGWILHETIRRTECSRVVFEGVRSRLEGGGAIVLLRAGGVLQEKIDGIEGRLKCGTHTEVLFLPRLGRRKPGV